MDIGIGCYLKKIAVGIGNDAPEELLGPRIINSNTKRYSKVEQVNFLLIETVM